jgi:endonuclease/exonuclease/phosphatase family metal-dependent hydrolase
MIVSLTFTAAAGSDTKGNRDRELTVMTQNMYPGTDFGEIFAAQTYPEVMAEVAEAFADVQASNVPERIAAIANKIEDSNPELVALQEVALWRTGPIGDSAPASTVAFDYLELLMDELASRNLHYSVAAVQWNFEAEVPGVSETFAADVRYNDRVVTLVRTDLAVSQLKLEGTQTATFENILTIPTQGPLGNITIPRGWTALDIKMRGKQYRFINAHLESFHPGVQYVQGGELLTGPSDTNRALILVGDFNSDAEAGGATYNLILAAGYSDVWEMLYPNDPGFTWPLFEESPYIFTTPDERLDLVLTRGKVMGVAAEVVGEDPILDRTPSLLRPSDHAGVVATLVLEP